MKYWLLKSEPNTFSIDDLKEAGIEPWDGIRNYQARNTMRDLMQIGDPVFIYHSRVQPIGIFGEGEVASAPYPDPTQFDPDSPYFDAKSSLENPRWILVDIKYKRHFRNPLLLPTLKTTPGLENMVLVQKGSRLSVQPVSEREWEIIQELGAGS